MSQQLTKSDARELHELAKSINDREATIEQLKGATIGKANEAVTEAILQGQELLKAKAMIPHGMFMAWLSANCPLVSQAMANRYMRIASNCARVTNLTDADSIRAALTLIADAHSTEHSAPPTPWPAYLEGLNKFTKSFAFLKANPLSDWPEEGRAKLRDDLEPIARALWPDRFA